MATDRELLAQRPCEDILDPLDSLERIRHAENGNRAFTAKAALRKLKTVLPKVGIQRIAEITRLADFGIPVFQCSRPNLLFHALYGQNSGALGKGLSKEQAMVSSIMESIETFCAEPRHPALIRGAYDFLKRQHLVADPRGFARNVGNAGANAREPLMWTEALSIELKAKVLVPAECVYLPFMPDDYGTRPIFSRTSNGLGAGLTYLEALIHALYEVIERHYVVSWEAGLAKARRLHEEEYVRVPRTISEEFETLLYSLALPGIRNLPMMACMFKSPWVNYLGYGCSADPVMSATRAFTEAAQGRAASCSGTREDLSTTISTSPSYTSRKGSSPAKRSLRLDELRRATVTQTFRSLGDEVGFLVRWLHQAGFQHIFVVNLTRVGVDVPVVKVLVPGLRAPNDIRTSTLKERTTLDLNQVRFKSLGKLK